jgi:salicylate hydroxylase
VKDGARTTVHFSDGTSVEADVVLLANGIRGAGREAVTGKDAKENIVFSNATCYRGLVPLSMARAAGVTLDLSDRPLCVMGMGKVFLFRCAYNLLKLILVTQHLIMFPIRGGKVVRVHAIPEFIDHVIMQP